MLWAAGPAGVRSHVAGAVTIHWACAAPLRAAWREAYARRGYAVTAADPSAEVIHHIALVTFPPDARYSPLAPATASAGPGQPQGQRQGRGGARSAQSGQSFSGGAASWGALGRELQEGSTSTTGRAGDAGEGAASGSGSPVAEAAVGNAGLVRALVFPVGNSSAQAPENWQVGRLDFPAGGCA